MQCAGLITEIQSNHAHSRYRGICPGNSWVIIFINPVCLEDDTTRILFLNGCRWKVGINSGGIVGPALSTSTSSRMWHLTDAKLMIRLWCYLLIRAALKPHVSTLLPLLSMEGIQQVAYGKGRISHRMEFSHLRLLVHLLLTILLPMDV